MSKFHKSYRIRTNVGGDTQLHVKLDNEYDTLEIMSLKIDQKNAYKLHTSNYGVIAGRVLANGAFGVPNAKISVFINIDNEDINDVVKSVLYPYNTTSSKNKDGVRYNLLTEEQLSDCHTVIGTFPEKQYMLDNDSLLEVFEKYYKFTTRTNKSGDYMIFGIPTGSQTIHVDIDLSDIGILSQKPRDMVYKGYNIEQFENPNKFKYDTNLDSLTHVISQDTITDVIPFWGDNSDTSIGITRCDIDIQYKFEPTCVFMGSVISDNSSNGISKKCVPMPGMGVMEDLTTGSGTIEMIRKTPSGDVEEFQIKGTQLINGDGVWCYQIPMNLDYVKTDEYGNTVPTDDPSKGIPTRTRVRFRMSLQDFDNNNANIFRCKMLVPHNPDVYSDNCSNELDYQFGTKTAESSYRDLFWNGVYSVKSYIPRIQKGSNWKNEKFTGFKRVNYHGSNNPLPYNNIRIKIPLMYTVMCVIFKMMITLTGFLNRLFKLIGKSFVSQEDEEGNTTSGSYLTLSGEMCDESLESLCIIPGININKIVENNKKKKTTLLGMTFLKHYKEIGGETSDVTINSFEDDEVMMKDTTSMDYKNAEKASNKGLKFTYQNEANKEDSEKKLKVQLYGIKVTDSVDYLVKCIEMNLAQEFKVIQFDFYNDWINGVIYIPRWVRNITKKRTFLWGALKFGGKVKACNENYKMNRNLVQQCGLTYDLSNNEFNVTNHVGCSNDSNSAILRCHKNPSVRKTFKIFGNEGGIVRSIQTMHGQYVYYFKPYDSTRTKNVRLFSTDIILLGTLNDCDKWGIPNDLTELYSSTYQMPPNLALTDSDIEGEDYELAGETDYIEFMMNNNKESIVDISLNNCYKGISIMGEGGNYTEVAGINWGYTGPLQASKDSKNATSFYKPGGHFLGLTCRNSETTIKTCVNLTRICEHGVWMSQRKNLDIPTSKNNTFLNYATVPSGLISKDEISDTDYRRLFASMNKNRLRTIIDSETGYPKYDFEYVNPTNFNGELKNSVKSESDMNRHIKDRVTEYEYEYTDDNYHERELDSSVSVDEVQIMRTGEYKDDEYFKYRFGLNDSNITNSTAKSKRFLIGSGNSYSFPIFDNSFYFYFGLRDGKTALDEFKRIYYANCEKMESLTQIDNSIVLKDLKVEYDGVVTGSEYKSAGSGSISFKLKTNEQILSGGLNVTMKNENGNTIKCGSLDEVSVKSESTVLTYTKLSKGTYTVNVVSANDTSISNSFTIEVSMIDLKGEINAENFVRDVSKMSSADVFKLDRNVYKGYITIINNSLTYKLNNESISIDAFSNYVSEIKIKASDDSFISNESDSNKQQFKLNGYTTAIAGLNQTTKEYMIPVHKCDIKYTVSVKTYLDSNGRLSETPSNRTHTWVIGTINVDNVLKLDALFNGISYNNSLKSIIDGSTCTENSYTGWWANNENGGISIDALSKPIQWNLKQMLYLDSLKKSHKITIKPNGGISPHAEQISCMKESRQGDEAPDGYLHTNYAVYTEVNKSAILNDIKIPTINFISGKTNAISSVKRRKNFKYKVSDVNGQSVPDSGSIILPVIYKPFFMEMGLWYLDSVNKFYMHGNVYNGITWDYRNEGFNNVTLNDVKLVNAIGTLENDDSYMALNEPTIKSENTIYRGNGGYSFTGITSGNTMLPYFRYNGRKVIVDRQIESVTCGLYVGKVTPNVNISIGCSHSHDGVTYASNTICETDSGSGVTFFKYTFQTKNVNNSYSVKMTTEGMPSTGLIANTYTIDTADYPYPSLINENLSVDDKLFRHIMDGKIKNSSIVNFASDGYFTIGNASLANKKIFYVTIINGGGGYSTETGNIVSTNEYNKIKAISVSSEINLGSLAKFYPMSITAKITDIWNVDKSAYETKLCITNASETFKNKKIEFTFLEEINGSGAYSPLLTITTYSGSNTELTYDLTSQRSLLKVHNLEDPNKPKRWLRLEYDVYDGSEKSPTTFVYQDTDGKYLLPTEHTDKPAEPATT